MTRWKRHMTALFALTMLFMLFFGQANAQPGQQDGPIGHSQDPLVTNTPPINAEEREKFALLTLSNPEGTCSASMLNDFWAITAAHCVFSPTTGLQFTPAQITLTANWSNSTKTGQVLRVIPYSNAAPWTPSDIAILQTSYNDFIRPVPFVRTLHDQRPMGNLSLYSFGRGINQLAFWSGSIANPSQSDGQYRSARFDISSIFPNSNLPPQTFSFAVKMALL